MMNNTLFQILCWSLLVLYFISPILVIYGIVAISLKRWNIKRGLREYIQKVVKDCQKS